MKKTILISSIIIIAACHKIQSYPDTPTIHYKEFNYKDTSLVFTFIDGDGNFGFLVDTLSESDTTDSSYNVFSPLEVRRNGRYEAYNDLKNWRYHISDVPLPQGQNKTQNGEIKLRFYFLFMDSVSSKLMPDTFRFKFWITDTLNNKSNIDSTPDLYKSKVGLQ